MVQYDQIKKRGDRMRQIRNTPQREIVRQAMHENYSHPTAEEIYEQIHLKHPNISFATVYRNLNLLAQQGEIFRLHMPEGPDHYDYTTSPHYHFLCRQCNRIVDAEIPFEENFDHYCPPGCKTESHILTLIGLCPECQK